METGKPIESIPPILEAQDLSKTYALEGVQVRALCRASLQIFPGDFAAIMGPSGSGKSTLMHLLGCLDTPDSGKLLFDRQEIQTISADQLAELRNQKIGFVFQDFNLLAKATAVENVEMPLVYLGVSPEERRARALAALDLVGLKDRAGHFPNQLSGGEQQRVAIARAFVTRPRLILADEPTGNLDSRNGLQIIQLFRRLHAQGMTILLITHDAGVACFAARQIHMSDGEITEDRINDQFEPLMETVPPALGEEKIAEGKAAPAAGWRGIRDRLTGWSGLNVFLAAVRLGLQALQRYPFRTLLTMLGIIIGVGSIITISGVGKNFYLIIQHQIFKLARNLVFVSPSFRYKRGGKAYYGTLTEDDVTTIRQVCPNALEVIPEMVSGGDLLFGNRYTWVKITGSTEGYSRVVGLEMARGHFITPQEIRNAAKVCVISQIVADELFPDRDPIGQTVELKRVPFEVVGLLRSEAGNLGKVLSGMEREVIVPISTFKRRLSRSKQNALEVEKILVLGDESENLGLLTFQITRILRWRHGIRGGQNSDFYVRNTREMGIIVGMMLTSILVCIVAIASISLVVGGIGIMNIMLVSVTERTREIGIRMAIGAKQGDILRQFLIESMSLSGSGGAIGIVGGLCLAFCLQVFLEAFAMGFCQFDLWALLEVIGRFLQYPLISLILVLGAFGFSAFTGIFFGLYPAWRASKLDPIRALRTL
jgi:macrolide transport system ATP-binding/permease protein